MARTVFPCKEFEPVDVPLEKLLREGKVSLYPAAEKYFDLDYRNGRLVVAPKSFVGLIPINDEIAIQVTPRFPIKNLFHILQRASATLRFIEGFTRTYLLTTGRSDDPIGLLADRFVALSRNLQKTGLLRRYVQRAQDTGPGGALDVPATIEMYRSRGIRHRHVWRETDHTLAIRENQLLKTALERIAAYYSGGETRNQERLRQTREALFLLDQVAIPAGFFVGEHEIAQMVARLPNAHREYAALLWLAYLLHARRGVSIEVSGNASFDTFVVNLADVFEDYVRLLVSENADNLVASAWAIDGNRDQVPLFLHGGPYTVKPDIYLKTSAGHVAVLDAKYKPALKSADRYEVLAFCEALQVKTAIVLSPGSSYTEPELLGTTAGGIRLHLVRINLNAHDMAAAENQFIDQLRGLFASASLRPRASAIG